MLNTRWAGKRAGVTLEKGLARSIPARVEERMQPWKAYWAPSNAKENVEQEKAYGFAKGEIVAIYGN
jgi:hypothetical protein